MKIDYFKGVLLSALVITSLLVPFLLSRGPTAVFAQEPVRVVNVRITPKKQSGVPSTWLHFTLTVQNCGDVVDNYRLTYLDDLGWTIRGPDNLLNVQPGENRQVSLLVHVGDWPISTHDNVIVIATSMIDETVSDNDLCIAHVGNPQRSVDVTILPRYQWVGDILEGENFVYDVRIYNAGTVADNYTLTAVSHLGWEVSIEPKILENVQPCEEGEATLNVVPGPLGLDEITVIATSQTSGLKDNDTCLASTLEVKEPYVVDVRITPRKKHALPSSWVHFEITIHNSGTKIDNYHVEMVPDGWPDVIIDPWTIRNVEPCENVIVDLYIHVPDWAVPCENKEIIVVVTSTGGATDNDVAVVHVEENAQCAVDVTIEPRYQSGKPSENLYYAVTVHNWGNISDNYRIVVSQTENWDLKLIGPLVDNQLENIAVCESVKLTLEVHVPECIPASTMNTITVIAESKTCGVKDNDSAIAHVERVAGVEVSISPKLQSGPPRRRLTYTVTVTNLGNWEDDFNLGVGYFPPWKPELSSWSLEDIPPHGSKTVTLTVYVPTCVQGSTTTEIEVYAWSAFDLDVVDMDNCGAHAENFRAVYVSISPDRRSGAPGKTLAYVVTVWNQGNLQENFQLSVDNEWPAVLKDNWLLVPKCSSRTTVLRVTIPPGTAHSTENVVRITATSQDDSTIIHSASCVAHAFDPAQRRAVRVSIRPSYRSVPVGTELSFTVTVYNRGGSVDDFNLSYSAPSGWTASLSPTSLTGIPAGGSGTATLTVTVPSAAVVCQRYTITVTATSVGDPSVSFTTKVVIHRRS